MTQFLKTDRPTISGTIKDNGPRLSIRLVILDLVVVTREAEVLSKIQLHFLALKRTLCVHVVIVKRDISKRGLRYKIG